MARNPPSVLCMDIGTSSVKAGLIDDHGALLWFKTDPILKDKNLLEDWDPAIWTASLSHIIATLYREVPNAKPQALVLSGNGPTIVGLDAHDRLLKPALLWIDGRREALPGSKSFFLPKLQWLKSRHPAVFAQVRTFFSCPEYLNFLLTGERWTISPAPDFIPYIWAPSEIEHYGFDAALFPPFRLPSQPVGSVTHAAAHQFGLPQGLPVFAGGSDFMMSLAGTATLQPGQACDRAGSSEGINYCSGTDIVHPNLRTLPHLIPGRWNVAGILSSTGLMFEWFRGISGQTERPYEEMLAEIRSLPVEDDLPWFFPNHQEAESWEFGTGMFRNLKAKHDRRHLGRAVVESIGFAVRQSLENLADAGCPVSELRLCGGQAKNTRWASMKADISGVDLLVPEVKDAELVGDAIMAFIGLGRFSDIPQAAQEMVRFTGRITPNPQAHEAFSRRYQQYLALQWLKS